MTIVNYSPCVGNDFRRANYLENTSTQLHHLAQHCQVFLVDSISRCIIPHTDPARLSIPVDIKVSQGLIFYPCPNPLTYLRRGRSELRKIY